MNIYKGDIFYIHKPKQYQTTGSEQDAGRPEIIVSNDTNNYHSEIVEVVYLTTKEKKPLPTHVEVMCLVPSTALCEQINSVSKERIGDYIRTCTDAEMESIDNALLVSLGISRTLPDFTEQEVAMPKTEYDKLVEESIALKKELDELKRCDKVVILPDDAETESETKLVFERNFYKAQYEALFERVIGKAVQV